MTPDLEQTLVEVADALADAAEPWWIIGSAALALHGAAVTDVADVDVLMSPGDAARTLRRLGVATCPKAPSSQFRSAVFGVWRGPPLTVEIMAGFSVAAADGWRAVSPTSRKAVALLGRELFVPSAAELREILGLFGRPKDLQRLRLLPD